MNPALNRNRVTARYVRLFVATLPSPGHVAIEHLEGTVAAQRQARRVSTRATTTASPRPVSRALRGPQCTYPRAVTAHRQRCGRQPQPRRVLNRRQQRATGAWLSQRTLREASRDAGQPCELARCEKPADDGEYHVREVVVAE